MPQPALELIEAGVVGEDLPLFVRREAARHAERLAAEQVAHAAATESRLTSILSWSIGALVAGALWAATPQHAVTPPLAVAALALGAAALLSAAGLWPRRWIVGAYTLAELQAFDAGSEFEHLDMVARGLNGGALINARRLKLMARLLRSAWLALLVAGVAAIAAMLARMP